MKTLINKKNYKFVGIVLVLVMLFSSSATSVLAADNIRPTSGNDILPYGYYEIGGFKWIEARLKGILDRKKLTDAWKANGIKQNYEYAVLTNEIYQEWSGMKASQYKEYKNIRKESFYVKKHRNMILQKWNIFTKNYI